MENKNFALEEKRIADILRQEILKDTESATRDLRKEKDLSNFECISVNKAPVSPIMMLNEDQILDFVEQLDVNTLSKLSVAELNYIGEVLGVEPKILFGLEEE